jgi:Ser/Thr protein kinase RdoA (MazF antagonist)
MMRAPVLLPGQMTPEEQRGFRIACACFATWGYQLAADPSVGGSPARAAARAQFRKHGRVVSAMAAALDRQLGQPGPARLSVHMIPDEALAEMAAPASAP